VVKPIHPKAMPIILTTEEERDVWSARRGARQKALRRKLPDDVIRVLMRGEGKEDKVACMAGSRQAVALPK
jgi:putative SOS response-associated peptidase YedK